MSFNSINTYKTNIHPPLFNQNKEQIILNNKEKKTLGLIIV